MKHIQLVNALLAAGMMFGTASARDRGQPALEAFEQARVATAEVGDPDSFGRRLHWLGFLQTDLLDFQTDCSGGPVEGERCVEMPADLSFSEFDERDLASISLPARAATTMICQWITPFIFYSFDNPSKEIQPAASLFLQPYVTVESELFDDPSLRDPVTGNPLDGAYEFNAAASFYRQRQLIPSETSVDFTNFSRVCIAGILNPVQLSELGLSEKQIRKFFRKPITIRFNVRGSTESVGSARIFYGMRLVGS